MLYSFDMETGGLEPTELHERPAGAPAAMPSLDRELQLGLRLHEYDWSQRAWRSPTERGE